MSGVFGRPGVDTTRTRCDVTRRASRIDPVKAGSIVVSSTIDGPPSPQRAMKAAVAAFNKEFGRTPDWDRVRFVGFTTTATTHIELIEEPT